MTRRQSRRSFIIKSGTGAVGLSMAMSAKSYSSILGANDRMNFGGIGLHGRGKALVKAISVQENTALSAICDVDKREFDVTGKMVQEAFSKKAKTYTDVRKLLEDKAIDAIFIAAPDHWHAPMALMGVQADKHVYVEKPCSHNPREGELLIEAQKKYGKVIQMGNQQRSAPASMQAMKDIKEGLIGEVYYGKAWYANNRKSIGVGKETTPPDWLDWDLWQGPAPREAYKDNYVHYNWHWFWQYGTGEVNNNGLHEIDVCRWALGVDYPIKVSSSGGRYHFNDDWQFYDTQIVNYEYRDGKMISWEGRSCNGFLHYDRGRGATLHGTKGTILLDRNTYIARDLEGNILKDVKEAEQSDTINTVGAGYLDTLHMKNFIAAVKDGTTQNSPIDQGAISNNLCHLGNYAQAVGRTLNIDPSNGRIKNDADAMKYWSREYEQGWEMKV